MDAIKQAVLLETFLAKLYTDEQSLRNFLERPQAMLQNSPLNEEQRQQLLNLDRAGLLLAFQSYQRKRQKCRRHSRKKGFLQRAFALWPFS